MRQNWKETFVALLVGFTAFTSLGEPGSRRLKGRSCLWMLMAVTTLTSPLHTAVPPPYRDTGRPEEPARTSAATYSLWDAKNGAAEVEVFNDGWFENQVAEQIKARLQTLYPEVKKLKRWSSPGLRVPLHTLAFVPDSEDSQKVRLEMAGIFFRVVSLNSFDLSELTNGKPQRADFESQIQAGSGEAVDLEVQVQFRLSEEGDAVLVPEAVGKLRAFNSFFTKEDRFQGGPWNARPTPARPVSDNR